MELRLNSASVEVEVEVKVEAELGNTQKHANKNQKLSQPSDK